MDAFVETAPARWGISPGDVVRARPPAAGCRRADRSRRNVGPTWLVVGDAAGSVNPFNGEGISLAYETGRMAADAVDRGAHHRRRARAAALPAAARGGVRPLLQGGARVRAGDRQPGGDARAHAGRHAVAARSWSGCCGSWPTCCAPTSSAPPRPPTRWSPPWSPWPRSRNERGGEDERSERSRSPGSERPRAGYPGSQ